MVHLDLKYQDLQIDLFFYSLYLCYKNDINSF